MELIITTKDDLRRIILEAIKESSSEKPSSEPKELLIDKKEAAKILGVSVPTIDNYRRNGILPSYRFGNRVRFRYSEVINIVDNV